MTNASTELLRVLGEPLCWPLLSGLWASSPSTLPSPSQAHSSDHIMVHSESPGLFERTAVLTCSKGKGPFYCQVSQKLKRYFVSLYLKIYCRLGNTTILCYIVKLSPLLLTFAKEEYFTIYMKVPGLSGEDWAAAACLCPALRPCRPVWRPQATRGCWALKGSISEFRCAVHARYPLCRLGPKRECRQSHWYFFILIILESNNILTTKR